MKNLIIVGGGGMGRSVYCIAQGCRDFGVKFTIKGFIDDDLHSLDGFKGYPPLIDTIQNYKIQPDDVFICSIGNVNTKKRICEELKKRGAEFITLIHKTAIVRQNAVIGPTKHQKIRGKLFWHLLAKRYLYKRGSYF